MKKATMLDVAKLAGVTAPLVSRYINKDTNLLIKQETREKIQNAIDILNYRPNNLARSLRVKKSNSIAILIPDITNPFFTEIIKGAQISAAEKGITLILCETDDDERVEAENIRMFNDKYVDGILVATIHDHNVNLQLLKDLDMKFVLMTRTAQGMDVPYVKIDDYKGACSAMEHLIENGHKSIAHIAGSANTATGLERTRAYYDIMKKYRLETPEEYVIETKYLEHQGFWAMERLIALPHRPTALFCCNDMTAIGAYKAMEKHGLSVPGDISIIGFDNIWVSGILSPALTTIETHTKQVGQKAFESLYSWIENRSSGRSKIILDPMLIQRKSVKKI